MAASMNVGATEPDIALAAVDPPYECRLCPRLAGFIDRQKEQHPEWFNGPVPNFGDPQARLLVVGLAPGLRGANRTGRPFTGDYAGRVLYDALDRFGFSEGTFDPDGQDDLKLEGALITNAVRCVPPENKPIGAEINTCNAFLTSLIEALPRLKILLALGRISHDATLKALGLKRSAYPFAHAAVHDLGESRVLIDSYHCSRYNVNTGRLTMDMFDEVFAKIESALAAREG